ncbi:MAG TPA: hypothetical protein VFG30_43100 [Polyangiales bacterium]|nr:hypothetical protein [Polyangiales bacterium]
MREGIVFAAIVAASAAMLSCGGSDDEPLLFVTIHTRKIVPTGFEVQEMGCMSLSFFESGKTDRFEVETPIGTRYQLAHRGAFTCEQAVDLFAE